MPWFGEPGQWKCRAHLAGLQPDFGWYETTLHGATIRCGEETLTGLAGIMPEELARVLPEVDGVIGTQMLRKGPVHFDLAQDVLTFI